MRSSHDGVLVVIDRLVVHAQGDVHAPPRHGVDQRTARCACRNLQLGWLVTVARRAANLDVVLAHPDRVPQCHVLVDQPALVEARRRRTCRGVGRKTPSGSASARSACGSARGRDDRPCPSRAAGSARCTPAPQLGLSRMRRSGGFPHLAYSMVEAARSIPLSIPSLSRFASGSAKARRSAGSVARNAWESRTSLSTLRTPGARPGGFRPCDRSGSRGRGDPRRVGRRYRSPCGAAWCSRCARGARHRARR